MKASEIITLLKKDGWFEIAQKGSHKQFKHNTKKGRVTVPYHSNVDLSIAVIKKHRKTSPNKNFK